MTPRNERIAFQIWSLMQQTGGDCTLHDMADVTGAGRLACRNICQKKGWSDYRRTSSSYLSGTFGRDLNIGHDDELDDLARRASA